MKLLKGGKDYPAIGNGALFFLNDAHAKRGLDRLKRGLQ
jgi:hypothetical protein